MSILMALFMQFNTLLIIDAENLVKKIYIYNTAPLPRNNIIIISNIALQTDIKSQINKGKFNFAA